MEVFRITLSKWSSSLTGSGYPARWNSKGIYVVYTAGSTALAILENIAHRNGEGLNKNFKQITIEIPKSLGIKKVSLKSLPKFWYKVENYNVCQEIGDRWVRNQETAVLEVPSSIVTNEKNYILNPNHQDFRKIKIKSIQDFEFDPRIRK